MPATTAYLGDDTRDECAMEESLVPRAFVKENSKQNSPGMICVPEGFIEGLLLEKQTDPHAVIDLHIAIHEAVQSLAPRELQVILLLYFDDMTRAEACERMEISLKELRTLRRQALVKLRRMFFVKN